MWYRPHICQLSKEIEVGEVIGETGQRLKNPAEVALDLYNVLYPYPSDFRQKAIQAALSALGEVGAVNTNSNTNVSGSPADFADLGLGPKALKWVQKFGITREALEEAFHFNDGRVEICASEVPGSSRREMTVNCYLLCGLQGLLGSDSPTLEDGEAIAVCKRLAAYDKNNHTSNRQAVGNKMSGVKPLFTLTGPGESAAADLVKQMSSMSRSG
jgi:hypothetical protein